MKTSDKRKTLTFGDFIASVYDARSKQKAREIVRLFVNAHLVTFRGRHRYVVS